MTTRILSLLLVISAVVLPIQAEPKSKKKTGPELDASALNDQLHPLFHLENLHPDGDVHLKISAMAFHEDDLYVTTFTPDRMNKNPDKKGKIYKVSGLIGNSDRSKIKAELIMDDLYEPTAILVFKGKIYVGEKDKISRLEDQNNDNKFTTNEKIVLIDGLSQPNFHTFTIGFDSFERDGKTYLTGNLSTSVLLGGNRAPNTIANPKVKRGSTFLLGPITGDEKPSETDISYVAGGFRTPNGFAVGPDKEIIVLDNQGIFNPSNEFIRVKQSAFYGHYLEKKKDTTISAFQPEQVDSTDGGSKYQTPATVHIPQITVGRSPSEPVILNNLTGPFAAYNGQWLVGDLTLGRINRIFLEEVEGVWQGAAFLHSGGHDPEGKTGFTAGPNRMEQGPDGNYYIGQIGHGGLWQFISAPGEKPKPLYGLQRLSLISPNAIPSDFNEMLAVRDIKGGLEIEFFKPLSKQEIATENFELEQWTYIPTKGYGGSNIGTESLKVTKAELSSDRKKIRLTIPGIRDNSPPFVKAGNYTNENVGWVIELKTKGLDLYKDTAWYTMQHHQGGGATSAIKSTADPLTQPIEYAIAQHKAICAACHTTDGSALAGPSFKGLFGKKQTVTHQDGTTSQITIDEDYLYRAISNPLADIPEGFPPAMPDPGLSKEEQKAMIEWIKTLK